MNKHIAKVEGVPLFNALSILYSPPPSPQDVRGQPYIRGLSVDKNEKWIFVKNTSKGFWTVRGQFLLSADCPQQMIFSPDDVQLQSMDSPRTVLGQTLTI